MSIYLGFIEARAAWMQYNAGGIIDDANVVMECIRRMKSRPDFETVAEFELAQAEAKVREALELIVEARTKFKALQPEGTETCKSMTSFHPSTSKQPTSEIESTAS